MTNEWSEEASADFLDYGRFFVPTRETQIQLVCDLMPPLDAPGRILDLACGEGLLAEAILQQHPHSSVLGLDGSAAMRQQAAARLVDFGPRFEARPFDLFDHGWRQPPDHYHAIVSSLAIHHLDDAQKETLYEDLYGMLQPGGALLIADLIFPASAWGMAVAAAGWDSAVQQRSRELAGNDDAFHAFRQGKYNIFCYPDPMDRPSPLFEQLNWLYQAGFRGVDVFWLQVGHAIFGGYKN